MKLGTKITLGFLSLIAIMVTLGVLAIWSMLGVKQTSQRLVEAQMPSMELTTSVERAALHTMFEARGYAYTEEKSFLETARTFMDQTKKRIGEAKEHAAAQNLPVLKENAALAESRVAEYEQLLNDSVTRTDMMAENRNSMNTAAAKYVEECEKLYKAQEVGLEQDCAEMRKQLAQNGGSVDANAISTRVHERFAKVKQTSDILAAGNAIRVQCWKAVAMRDPAALQRAAVEFDKVDDSLDKVKSTTHQEANLKIIDECRAASQAYRQAMESYLQNWTARESLNSRRVTAANDVLSAAQRTFEGGMKETTTDATNAAGSLSTASLTLVVGLAVGIVTAILLAVFITRGITKPLRRIITGLTEGSDQVSSASGQVSAASQSLAEGATEQAAGLEETSSSLEEMSSMTKQNADNAQQANTLAAEAKKAAGSGAESMSRMNSAIHEIQKSSDETAKIIKVIDEIAFQTNLLALNAAVEAARAGEAGKGFAVVAEEVRNLAMRSAEAAKNTASMIEESVKNSKNGVDIAAEVGKVLEEIVQSVGKTTDLVSEIAAASQEQAQGIDQVNTAVSQMDKVTQQNAANAEESASASEELSAQAESMKEIVGQLVAMVGGSNSHTVHTGATKSDRHSVHADNESRLCPVSKSRSRSRGLGKSDEVLHKIAGTADRSRQKTTKEMEKSIPLGTSEADLSEFNS
jgi:methyl-accepting chemotaxis protein